MPELFEQNSVELPANRRERSAGRGAPENIVVDQVLKYEEGEGMHQHRTPSPAQRNRFSCFIQEMVGRINRTNREVRLKSVHDEHGSIYIYCEKRRRRYDN